jgi:hypothetical protein
MPSPELPFDAERNSFAANLEATRELRASAFEYIAVLCKGGRRHSTLGYPAPEQCEEQSIKINAANEHPDSGRSPELGNHGIGDMS